MRGSSGRGDARTRGRGEKRKSPRLRVSASPRRTLEAILTVCAAAFLTTRISLAQSPSDLEPERPISVEDARAVAYRALSGSADWTYNRRQDALDDFGPGFSLRYGALRGLEVGASIRYVTRPGRNFLRGISSGDLFLHGLYALRVENADWPALAIRMAVQLPTGLDSKGTDLHITGLATRSFDTFRLHANAHWTRLGDAGPHTRREQLEAIAGTDFLLNRRGLTDTLALADLVARTNPVISGRTIVAAEIGVRQRIGMRTVFFGGTGTEITGSPDRTRFRIRAGVTHTY